MPHLLVDLIEKSSMVNSEDKTYSEKDWTKKKRTKNNKETEHNDNTNFVFNFT